MDTNSLFSKNNVFGLVATIESFILLILSSITYAEYISFGNFLRVVLFYLAPLVLVGILFFTRIKQIFLALNIVWGINLVGTFFYNLWCLIGQHVSFSYGGFKRIVILLSGVLLVGCLIAVIVFFILGFVNKVVKEQHMYIMGILCGVSLLLAIFRGFFNTQDGFSVAYNFSIITLIIVIALVGIDFIGGIDGIKEVREEGFVTNTYEKNEAVREAKKQQKMAYSQRPMYNQQQAPVYQQQPQYQQPRPQYQQPQQPQYQQPRPQYQQPQQPQYQQQATQYQQPQQPAYNRSTYNQAIGNGLYNQVVPPTPVADPNADNRDPLKAFGLENEKGNNTPEESDTLNDETTVLSQDENVNE